MKTKFLSGLKKKDRGQSLVEMAISLMVIMLIVLGAVETGMAIFQYVTISDAVQEAANYASVNPGDRNSIGNHAVAAASDVMVLDGREPFQGGNVIVTVNHPGLYCEGSVGNVPNSITVTIQYDHKIIFPLYPSSKPIPLRSSATYTILYPPC